MSSLGRPSARLRFLGALLLGAVLLLAAGVLTQNQVEVTGAADGGTRACGSAFDAATGRSGWERWWSADLDELQAGQPAQLVRTEDCPDAINRRLWTSGSLLGFGLLALGVAVGARVERGFRGRHSSMRRLGLSIATIGASLSVGGAVALVVLVADPSSTLFIYVDRLVVALIGLIVLVPALALLAIGRVIMIVGDRMAEEPRRP